MTSPNNETYAAFHSVLGSHFVNFKLKALTDAYIALSSAHEHIDVGGYTVALGIGAEISAIFVGTGSDKREVKATNTAGVLDPNTFQWFWLSWADGLIEVGTGEVKDESTVLVSWNDSNPTPVQSISVASGFAEADSGAQWEFSFDNGL